MKRNISPCLILALTMLFVLASFLFAPSTQANPGPDTAVYYPSVYSLLGQTQYVSGSLGDLQSDNGIYIVFRSYASATSPQTLYTHQETATIAGTNYYLLKTQSADAAGTTLSASMGGATGRKLWGRFVYSLQGVSSIPASTWTMYYRTWFSAGGAAHADVSILIRRSDGTIRSTIATNVANSASLTTTPQTLSGTYSWAAYTVVDQTDYLEIDFYLHVTTARSGASGYLRIDDNTLAIANQTRATNIILPSEYTIEVEFTGSSNTYYWTQLKWMIDSAWTIDNVAVTLQLYNYTLGSYPTSGNGYMSYTSSATPNTDETKSQTITTNPSNFRNATSNWKIKVKGFKSTPKQFDFKADLIQLEVTYFIPDTTPPSWSNAGTNNTVAGKPTLFHVKWTDNVGLSGFIFGTNNTGTWKNDTWTPMSGTTNWSNVTKILNNMASLVQWRVWANDTSNNWNNTGILSLTLKHEPVASFTYSPSTPYTSQTITFNASASYDSDGTIVSYSWTFGDGTNGTGMVTTHAYADNGIFTVTLTVTDNDGLTGTDVKSITVLNRSPIASFTESATTVPTGTVIYFNASASHDSDGFIVSYFWTFGDGTNASGVTVSHAYADNGTYTVTLKVTDNDGATATATAIKTITNRSPTASFTKDATTVYTGVVIHFNASSSFDPDGWIVSYFWTFGDGTNATGVTASHAYSDDRIYTVTLTIKDNDGATATATSTVTVLNRPPVVSFTESATTVYKGEVIHFNASASYDPDGSIVSYLWTFGDGTNATGMIVDHSYANVGTYTVTLTVTDNDGATASKTAVKTVLSRPPVARFTESATTVYTGDVITFNASASYDPDGTIVSYFWTFGDGTNATGVFVSHAYVDNGVYTVTLKVTDSDGATGTAIATKTVLNRPPVASFTESATTVLTGEVIRFNASASYDLDGSIVQYFWTFGDGTNATGVTVSHAYTNNGVYTVTLMVTDNDGATATATATKTVLNRPPVASFTESATTVYRGEVIRFNASASYDPDGSIISYFWTFDDGTNATGMVVDHAYTNVGTYVVTLTVRDDDGATTTTSATKTVLNRPPVAQFTESATTAYTGVVIYFNASGSYDLDGSIVSYFWTFGDGTNATGVTTSHAYVENGTYTVKLTITDNDNAKSTATSTKTILNRAPVASFTESATTVLTGEVIYFNASASYDPDGYIISYFWTFGDGANATGLIVSHAYADNGTYVVALTVKDNDLATTSKTATKIVLNRPPVALFAESATTVLTGEAIRFNASASYDSDGSIVKYFWNFGDGTNSTGMTVSHAYADNGVYTVTLTVSDNDGATGTAIAVKTVLNRPPVASFTESATTVLTNEVIYFNASSSYDPDGFIASYFWDFGDHTNATGITTQHVYVENGVYNVTLTITDNDGAKATARATKYVQNRPPVASFTFSPSFPIAGKTVAFNASGSYDPDGSIVSYRWNFGDGNVTTVTSLTIDHVYKTYGNYTVALTLTDNDGATSTKSQIVRIRDYPTAAFTYSPSFPIASEIATFNASSSLPNGGVITSYFWNFGDGTPPVNTTNPITTHVYSAVGNYTVTLTVKDSEGLTNTATQTVRVRGYPYTAFTFSPSYPIERETVAFDASSSTPNGGVITSYQWNFGDSNITTVQNPTITHVYSAIGNYTVTLTVTDSEGLSSSHSKILSVRGYPVAIFTYKPSAPYVGDTVTFNASLSSPNGGILINYMWNFGDGSPLLNATNPISAHIYKLAGNYTVTLTVTDSEGLSDTEVHSVVVAKAPIAVFTYSPKFPKVGEAATFNASKSYDPNGYIVSYKWNFGDGNITTVTTTIVTHTYKSTGIYTVILTVTDNDGYTDTATDTVTLGNPKASFTYKPTYPIVSQSITLNASASYDPNGYIVSYVWNFGDGNVTTVTNPIVIHIYKASGDYTIALTVADNDGLTDTTTRVISVGKAPVASFTYIPTTPYMGDTTTFNASSSTPSSGNITNYIWNFGDGSPVQNKTTPTITHVYTSAGNYTISLTIKDSVGLSNTATKTIKVLQSPVAVFTHSPTYPKALDTVTFNASDSYDPNGYIVSYVWNFGDGNIATVTTPIITHVYKSAANYTVVLIVADNDGYTHTTTRSVFVSMRPPVAGFASAPSFPIAHQSVTFNASSSYDLDGSIVSYRWNFGDGNITILTNPVITHQYLTFGNYTVTLTVTDDDSLTDTKTSVVRIRDYPTAAFIYTPSLPGVGKTTTFNASSSAPNGGAILYYLWNFGDGSPLSNTTNPILTHVFNTSGNYTITLTVTDNEGLSGSKSGTLYVACSPTASFTFSPSNPYVGDAVTFNASQSYDPDGYLTSFLWNFGDGSPPINTSNPVTTHVFNNGGNYTVTLTVSDNMWLKDSTALVVSIGKAPEAVFSYTPVFPIAGETVTFNASRSHDVRRPIVNYTWNFGDGNITTVTTPFVAHIYAKEGSYTVLLTVTDTVGYADTTIQVLGVRNYPIASFTYSPSYPIKGQSTTFDASTSQPRGGIITMYVWDFGDGTTPISTTTSIILHTYIGVGQYNVTLTVTDNEGLTSTASKTLKVRDYPTANFTWSPPSPIATQSITFDASSSTANSGVITGYMLELGDGTIKTGATPTIVYTYSKAKNYTVKLTVTNSEGLSSSVSKIVIVLDAPPIASFKYSPAVPIKGQTVTFNASNSYDPDGYIASYRWDFGDGNITTVTAPIIYHAYVTTGNFAVALTVLDNAGLAATSSQTVKIIAYPTASFTWSPLLPGSTESVTFNASASTPNSGYIASYLWNFGDGNTTTVTTTTIVHQYLMKGNYTATLTVTNSEGLSNAKSQAITVIGTPPIANFAWQPATPQAGEAVTFDASSSLARGGIITKYRWDFGDGTPPVLVLYKSTTTHTFATYGRYNVTLTVTDSEGLSDTKSKIVFAVAPPHAEFIWSPQFPHAYEIVTFDASASTPNGGTITSYAWNFGDGNITTVSNPTITHVYTVPRNYTVTLSITDSEVLSDTISKTVNVSGATGPQADFSYSPSSPYEFEAVIFNASASTPGTGNIVNYQWDFGDGNVTSVTVPIIVHAYQTSGNFTIALTVTNIAGLSNTKSKPISVLPISGPKADFTWLPSVPQPNKTVTFDASISAPGWNGSMHPPIIRWSWDFGDGNVTIVTGSIISHAYNVSRDYVVTLTVTDINGSTDSITKTVKVTSLLGDINGDGKVDIRDVAIVAKAFGSYPGDPNWNPDADLNGDGKVDIRDVAIVAKQFGKTLSSMVLFIFATRNLSYSIQYWTILVTIFLALGFMLTKKLAKGRKGHCLFWNMRKCLILQGFASQNIVETAKTCWVK